MPSYNTVAVVLRRINYGETDKILTLYARDRGRFAAIAKGARKAISRLSGATEVLTCTRFQLATGKSLDIITQSEVLDSYPLLRDDLPRLAHGLYLVDLTHHSVEDHAPNPDLFDLLTMSLSLMGVLSPVELVARWFEVNLLLDLGYFPDLHNCAVCRTALPELGSGPEDAYALSATLGGALCTLHAHSASNPDHSRLQTGALTLLQQLSQIGLQESESRLAEIATAGIERRALTQSELALRRYLRYRIERDLSSLEFLDQLRHAE